MINPDEVIHWLVDAPDEVICDLEEWIGDIEYGDKAISVTTAELDSWWEQFVLLGGGTMCTSLQREARLLLGQVAEVADRAEADDADRPDLVCVARREHLVTMDRNPSGVWRITLLTDKVGNALREYASWRTLEPSEAAQCLLDRFRILRHEAEQIVEQTPSIPARRGGTAIAALLASRTDGADAVTSLVDKYFALAAQARRESSSEPTLDELVFVASAGLAACLSAHDADGVRELWRRLRSTAELPGESMPLALLHLWSQGLREHDPAMAQMIAAQILRDVWDGESDSPTDEAFLASYSLFLATLALDEVDGAKELAQRWIPLAMDAEPSEGSQAWLGAIDEINL